MIKLAGSGKEINVEGLIMTEKQFKEFFGRLKPWKEYHEPKRAEVLDEDYKTYKKYKPKEKKEKGAE
ncbi:MAG: hypothetical protein GY928_14750 [Colwellia sp.]|nr:hypothetical protein [Colwellia sp.]